MVSQMSPTVPFPSLQPAAPPQPLSFMSSVQRAALRVLELEEDDYDHDINSDDDDDSSGGSDSMESSSSSSEEDTPSALRSLLTSDAALGADSNTANVDNDDDDFDPMVYLFKQASSNINAMYGDKKQLSTEHGQIHQNRPRLLAYTEEPNVGRGFIKELCFSTDGRLVCSPFAHGVRLLAFNPQCQELCDCIPEERVKLFEVSCNICHSSPVVTTKFSPTHCLYVSGCLDGKVAFHQPVL